MREIKNFNRGWHFLRYVEDNRGQIPKNTERINLPHTWNCEDGEDGGGDYLRTPCAYYKSFSSDDIPRGDCIYLEIGAANSYTRVYLNSELLGEHLGGYSLFRIDLTEKIQPENLLEIIVDNREISHAYPSFADFTFFGGIYRDVNIIGVPSSHFELLYYGTPGIKVTPHLFSTYADIEVEVYGVNLKPKQRLKYTIFDKEKRVVAQKTTTVDKTNQTLRIDEPRLWSGRSDPYLYYCEVDLLGEDAVLDTVKTSFGIRSFIVDAERGFFLNGNPYPLRGVSRHQDRKGLGWALSEEHNREDASLIYEMGASSVRLAHYQQAEVFYNLCDEYGFVVWAEIPYISKHKDEGIDNTLTQLTELIIQNYNHPSICFWGLSNEITMSGEDDKGLIENHKRLNELAHTLDRTRLTAVAAVSMCPIDAEYLKIPDLVAYNHYFGWYGGDVSMNGKWLDDFHKKYPDRPIGLSEYGAEALDYHTNEIQMGDYTEEYQAYYHEEMIKQLYTRPYLFATYVWNMFDFASDARGEGGEPGINHKGLITYDRKYKKDAFYAYKAWLSDEPFVHICGKRYVDRVEDITEIKVYSNQPSVELFVDNQSYETRTSDTHFFSFKLKNKGVQAIAVFAGECKDEARIRKVDEPNKEYRLTETGTPLSWYEISSPDGALSINDKIEVILSTKEGKRIINEIFERLKDSQKGDTGTALALNESTLGMLGGFSLLRFASMAQMMNVSFSREELLDINASLNKIRKKKGTEC